MERRISESGEDLCAVCSETMKIFATGECDHPICFKCLTRMRVLCEQMYCAICRRDLTKVAFTKGYNKFDSLNLKNFNMHQKYNIFFESDSVRMAFSEIQEHRCKRCKDISPFKSFPSLRDHMKREHTLFSCDLCVKHMKLFSSDRKFYDRKTLATHRRNGDVDDRSHKGHPLCKFCDERYLDNDELARHLRKDHYYCHFCDSDGISNQFYGEYSFLQEHFSEAHYLCQEGDCVDVQFTNAFRHKLDMKAHIASVHSKNLKRSMAKAARTLDVDINLAPRSKFNKSGNRGKASVGVVGREDYSEVSSQQNNTGSYGRGRNLRYLRDRREKEREAEEMSRAITASLNTATQNSVSVVDGNLLKKEPEKPPPDPVKTSDYKQNDFPDLSGKDSETRGKNSDSDEDKKVVSGVGDSMAQKIARASGFSVQDGSMNEEDFPSLGLGKKSTQWQHTAKGPASWAQSEDFPDLGGAKPRVSKVMPTWTKTTKPNPSVSRSSQVNTSAGKRGRQISGILSNSSKMSDSSHIKSASDFPSLNSISSTLTKGLSTGTASDALAKYAADGVSSSVQQSNVKLIETKPPVTVNPGPSVGKLQTSLNDFPSLSNAQSQRQLPSKGQSAVGQKAWGPKPTVAKNTAKEPEVSEEQSGYLKMKKKTKNRKIGSTNLSSEDSSESIKSLSEREVASAKAVLVEKKPEVAVSSSSDVQSQSKKVSGKKKSKSLKEGLLSDTLMTEDTADSSDSGYHNKKASGKTKSAKKAKDGKSSQGKVTPEAGDSKKPKEPMVLKSVENVTKIEAVKDDVLDFPSIHDMLSSSDVVPVSRSEHQEPKPAPKVTQRSVNVKSEDDFPVLGGLNKMKPAPPPPGFIKSTVPPTPPPGFTTTKTAATKKNPPPGFIDKPTATSDLAGIAMLLSNSDGKSKEPQGDTRKEQNSKNSGTPNAYCYVKPDDFSSRNQKLISDIIILLGNDEDKFSIFKNLSGNFRKGEISAMEYYTSCSQVIGADKFNTIFTELLVLLPDIVKQQNLLSAHKAKATRSGAAGYGLKKGWNVPKSLDFTVCSVCKQVLHPKEASSHQSKHNDDTDFPMLGAS